MNVRRIGYAWAALAALSAIPGQAQAAAQPDLGARSAAKLTIDGSPLQGTTIGGAVSQT